MTTQTFSHPIADLARRVASARHIAKTRRALAGLRALADRDLRAIGLDRSDFDNIRNWPLSVDAATELHRRSLMRSRQNG